MVDYSIAMITYWYIFVIIAAATFAWRKDLRREMVWAGSLALPILLFPVIINRSFSALRVDTLSAFIERGLLIFSLGAIASVLYEVLLGKTLSPQRHPDRQQMWWLSSGLVVFSIAFFGGQQSVLTSLLAGLGIDVIVIMLVRRDLIWDSVVSGTGLALLYGAAFFASLS